MDRRGFLKISVAATTVIMGSGLMLSSCKRDLRSDLMDINNLSGKTGNLSGKTGNLAGKTGNLDRNFHKILYYASLAPSGHNSQPWVVNIASAKEWIVGSDPNRWLPEVDGSNREVMLSIGAFIENLVQAALSFGYRVETTVITQNPFDSNIVKLNISKSKSVDIPLQKMVARRTVKSNMLSKELKASDVNDFSKSVDDHLFYFPTGTEHAKLMDKEAVDNYIIQSDNKKAMEELAFWVRLKDDDAKKYRDGLTPDCMEITGMAGWYVRHFMDNKDVMSKAFSDKGTEKTKAQVKEGAGWLVITSEGNSVEDLIETGRRFQRMALTAREKMIAIHPMTQALEEKHGQKNIKENHEPSMIPQFMLRVGYLNKYPDPVSLRRPVEWFVRS